MDFKPNKRSRDRIRFHDQRPRPRWAGWAWLIAILAAGLLYWLLAH